ncbi:MAG: fold, partial [Conexibacter sp.]|nr:fold [Conexibacter sp.]
MDDGVEAPQVDRPSEPLPDASELVRGAFTASTIGMAVLGLDLRIVLANGALEALLGRSAAELAGRRLSDLACREDRVATQRHEREVLAAAAVAGFHVEVQVARPDAAPCWLEVTASVL